MAEVSRIVSERQVPSAALRALKQPLYDTMEAPANANSISTLGFFQVPLGQNMNVTATMKTYSETNLQTSAQLGVPQEFELFGFQSHVHYAAGPRLSAANSLNLANDYVELYEAAVVKFILSQNRISLQIPWTKIPGGCMFMMGPKGSAIDAIAIQSLNNGEPNVKEFCKHMTWDEATKKHAPIFINSAENFALSLEYPVAAMGLTASGVNTRIQFYMVGILYASL